ncbi:MAG: rhomboid family intramembrane serine protease [Thermodesulfobacteriota bacterium]
MMDLYDNLAEHDAELCGLVLQSAGITYRVKKGPNGWNVRVDERQYLLARRTMAAYFRENRQAAGQVAEPSDEAFYRHEYAGVWVALVLAAVFFFVEQTGHARAIWSDFGAAADRIVDGEIFRTVTALFLHSDGGHLVGNMAGMAVFGTAVCQVAGWGVGGGLILLAGSAGNLINAIMYESHHLSIGASTAVFAAIGILSGYQFVRRHKTGRRRSAALLPIACGLALLGFLGSGGPHVDLGAHLFGFATGIAAGIGYAGLVRPPVSGSIQSLCLAAALGVILISWAMGYYG